MYSAKLKYEVFLYKTNIFLFEQNKDGDNIIICNINYKKD